MEACTVEEKESLLLTSSRPNKNTIEYKAWKEKLINLSATLENRVIEKQLPVFNTRGAKVRRTRYNQTKSVGAIVRLITDTISIKKISIKKKKA